MDPACNLQGVSRLQCKDIRSNRVPRSPAGDGVENLGRSWSLEFADQTQGEDNTAQTWKAPEVFREKHRHQPERPEHYISSLSLFLHNTTV